MKMMALAAAQIAAAVLLTTLATAQPGLSEGSDAAAALEADASAREAFQAGRSAFDSGQYEVALARWKHAYGLSGQPKLYHNIGLAHERLGQLDKAFAAYERYLKWESNAEVRAKVTAMRAKVQDAEPSPVRPEEKPHLVTSMAPAATPVLRPTEPRAPLATDHEGTDDLLPYATLASGVVLLLAGTTTGILALQKDMELDRLCGRPRMCMSADAREGRATADNIDTFSTVTDILLPLGALVVAVGSYLLWGTGDKQTQVSCTGDGCQGGAQWSF